MADLDRIAARQERLMLQSFNAVISDIRNNAVISEIVRALEMGNVEAVVRLLGMDEATWEPYYDAVRQSYREGGITGAAQIGTIPTPDGELALRFNVRALGAERWLAAMGARMVTEMIEPQRQMVRDVLNANLAAGTNPRQAALDLVGRVNRETGNRVGGFVGLTGQQASWVQSAREELEGLNSNYFTRQLRDRRFDGVVRRAIESGEPLNQSQINAAVTAMQARTQRYRGENIARTESINALRSGQHESIFQAVEAGEVELRDLEKTWDDSGDGRTRLDHLQMGQQYAEPIPFERPFVAPDGSRLMYPGDSSMGASGSQIINCRCRENITINFAGRLKRIEGFR